MKPDGPPGDPSWNPRLKGSLLSDRPLLPQTLHPSRHSFANLDSSRNAVRATLRVSSRDYEWGTGRPPIDLQGRVSSAPPKTLLLSNPMLAPSPKVLWRPANSRVIIAPTAVPRRPGSIPHSIPFHAKNYTSPLEPPSQMYQSTGLIEAIWPGKVLRIGLDTRQRGGLPIGKV